MMVLLLRLLGPMLAEDFAKEAARAASAVLTFGLMTPPPLLISCLRHHIEVYLVAVFQRCTAYDPVLLLLQIMSFARLLIACARFTSVFSCILHHSLDTALSTWECSVTGMRSYRSLAQHIWSLDAARFWPYGGFILHHIETT